MTPREISKQSWGCRWDFDEEGDTDDILVKADGGDGDLMAIVRDEDKSLAKAIEKLPNMLKLLYRIQDETERLIDTSFVDEACGILYGLEKPAEVRSMTERCCDQCGEEFKIGENEVANHVDRDGNVDHDRDADHVPYTTVNIKT